MSLINHMLRQMEELDAAELYLLLSRCEEKLAGMGIELTQRPKSLKAVRPKGPKAQKHHIKNSIRYKYRYFRCGKPNCSICAAGKKHGPYKIKVVTDRQTGKSREIYIGTHGKRRIKKRG